MTTSSSLIALIGAPTWANDAGTLLREHGFNVAHYPYSDRLITQVVNDQPALLLVDGDQSGWIALVSGLKSEQATRRIPILVIAADPALAGKAINAGAEHFLVGQELVEQLLSQVQDFARLPDPALVNQLACQCHENLPPLAQRAVAEFNTGAYYVQHDFFEKQWIAEPGPVRELYRAVLQVGVAYYHITRGNHAGALRMLQRSMQWFALLPDVCQGIDVRRLYQDAQRVRAALQAMSPADIQSFDRSLLQPIHLIPSHPVKE